MKLKRSSYLCLASREISIQIWNDLQDAHSYGIDVGEESITDYLLLNLKRQCPHDVIIAKFNKREEGRTTGADWEWWFVSNSAGFGMRVQAKKLDLKTMKYRSLDHRVGKTRRKQINLLIGDAKRNNLYPVYCFYNFWKSPPPGPHPKTCSNPVDIRKILISSNSISMADGSPVDPNVFYSCTVCDAHFVKACLDKKKTDLQTVGSAAFPLMCLVCCCDCPPSGAASDLPNRVQRFIQDMLGQQAVETLKLREIRKRPVRRKVPEPLAREALPNHVKAMMEETEEIPEVVQTYLSEQSIDGVMVVREQEKVFMG